MNLFLFRLFGFIAFALALCVSSSVQAQGEAASEVVGYIQAKAEPGKWVNLSPIFFPPVSASGLVSAVSKAPALPAVRVGWNQARFPLPDPYTSFLWPKKGGMEGRPLAAQLTSQMLWTDLWPYQPLDGSAIGVYPLKVGEQILLTPYFLIDEVAGSAQTWESNTTFAFKNIEAAVSVDSSGNPQWQSGSATGPALVIDDALGPYWIKRPASSVGSAAFVFVGTYAAGIVDREFIIRPKETTVLFRPDGQKSQPLFAPNTASLYLKPAPAAAIPLLGGATADLADKVILFNRETGLEESYYYLTGSRSWFRVSVDRPAVALTEAERLNSLLPAGAGIKIQRPGTTTGIVNLAFPSNVVGAVPTLAIPVTSTDKDYLPDGWELKHFPTLTPLATLATADPDLDGFTNAAEYLLGGNPSLFDHPGLLEVQPQATEGVVRSVLLSFLAVQGCRYRLETRAANEVSWTVLLSDIRGSGQLAQYQHSLITPDDCARFYRVVGMAPLDSDYDGLLDHEEWLLGTNTTNTDTDGDGVSDGTEMKPGLNRNPLDYWDKAVFSFAVSGDRQVGAPEDWLRESIQVKVTRKVGATVVALPPNLRVNFILTRGTASFAETASSEQTHASLSVRADSTGLAQAFVKLGSLDSALVDDPLTGHILRPIQGIVSVRVDSDPQNKVLYNESFTLYPSEDLIPPAGLLAWLKADAGITQDNTGAITRWTGNGEFGAGVMPNYPSPKVVQDPTGQPWLKFTGTEALLLDPFPAGSFTVVTATKTTRVRTASPVSTSTVGMTAGVTGQNYLLSGALDASIQGLPEPYDANSYRSYGLSLGAANVGLFDLGFNPAVRSPSLIPSVAAVGSTGLLLSLISPTDSGPLLRVAGKKTVAMTGPLGTAPVYPPRFIGGRAGSAIGTGMFAGDLSDVMIFATRSENVEGEEPVTYPGALSELEVEWAEDVLVSRHTYFSAGYKLKIALIDRDNDRLPDWWERAFLGNLNGKATDDLDKDKLTNLQELTYGTHPRMADTDSDGWSDSVEIAKKTNPTSWDTDNDLLSDPEDTLPNDPTNGRSDLDKQGFADGWDKLISQYNIGTDSDGDGLSDLFEVGWLNTRPDVATPIDSDLDGIPDPWEEAMFGSLDVADSESHSNDEDEISDRDEFLLGLNPHLNDLNTVSGGLKTEAILMDDQGRLRQAGDQIWGYDAEGNLILKN